MANLDKSYNSIVVNTYKEAFRPIAKVKFQFDTFWNNIVKMPGKPDESEIIELLTAEEFPKGFQDKGDGIRNPMLIFSQTDDLAEENFKNISVQIAEENSAIDNTKKETNESIIFKDVKKEFSKMFFLNEDDNSFDYANNNILNNDSYESTIMTNIDNYVASLSRDFISIASIVAGSNNIESLTNEFLSLVNQLSSTTFNDVKSYIKVNNPLFQKADRIIDNQRNVNLQNQINLSNYKIKLTLKCLQNLNNKEKAFDEFIKEEQIDRDIERKLREYFDDKLNKKTIKSVNDSLKYQFNILKDKLNEDFQESSDIDIEPYDAEAIYNKIVSSLREPINKLFNISSIDKWAIVEKFRKNCEDGKKSADKEIRARIEYVTNAKHDTKQNAGYGIGFKAGGNEIRLKGRLPIQESGLSHLWERYLKELDTRIEERVENFKQSPALKWMQRYATETIPNLIAFMITFRAIVAEFIKINKPIVLNNIEDSNIDKNLDQITKLSDKIYQNLKSDEIYIGYTIVKAQQNNNYSIDLFNLKNKILTVKSIINENKDISELIKIYYNKDINDLNVEDFCAGIVELLDDITINRKDDPAFDQMDNLTIENKNFRVFNNFLLDYIENKADKEDILKFESFIQSHIKDGKYEEILESIKNYISNITLDIIWDNGTTQNLDSYLNILNCYCNFNNFLSSSDLTNLIPKSNAPIDIINSVTQFLDEYDKFEVSDNSEEIEKLKTYITNFSSINEFFIEKGAKEDKEIMALLESDWKEINSSITIEDIIKFFNFCNQISHTKEFNDNDNAYISSEIDKKDFIKVLNKFSGNGNKIEFYNSELNKIDNLYTIKIINSL